VCIEASATDALVCQVKSFYTAYALVVGHTEGKGRLKGMCGALQLQMEE